MCIELNVDANKGLFESTPLSSIIIENFRKTGMVALTVGFGRANTLSRCNLKTLLFNVRT